MPTRKNFLLKDPQILKLPAKFGSAELLSVRCLTCQQDFKIGIAKYYKRRKHGPWNCQSCSKPTDLRKLAQTDTQMIEYQGVQSIVRCHQCALNKSINSSAHFKAKHPWVCGDCKRLNRSQRKQAVATDPQIVECPTTFTKGQIIWVRARCGHCAQIIKINVAAFWRTKQRDGQWTCYECRKPALTAQTKSNPLYKNEAYRQQFADLHKNPEYYNKVHNKEVRAKISITLKQLWADRLTKAKWLESRLTPEHRRKISIWAKQQWANPNYRQHQHKLRNTPEYKEKASARSLQLWNIPSYRALIIDALDKARPHSAPKSNISSLQNILYNILTEAGISYEAEGPATIIGPIATTNKQFEGYSFDCLVNHNGHKLLIECHGDYWHKDPIRQSRDLAKAIFINNYFKEYELLVIWEYEYRSPTRIKQIIAKRLGLDTPQPIDFSFKDIIITIEKTSKELYCFMATNHYLANIGRFGSHRIVARHNGKIVGAAVFSHPTRKESYERLKIKKSQILELTRFCIDESYHKKNFASWLLSKCIKIIKSNNQLVHVLLSFADSGFGHNGTIYKACNWVYDGAVKPDYWYSDGKNWFHKKSIWDLASKNGQKEVEYATQRGLNKVMGREKSRFLYWLK